MFHKLVIILIVYNYLLPISIAADEPLTFTTYMNVDGSTGLKNDNSKKHSSEAILYEAFKRAGLKKPSVVYYHFNRGYKRVADGTIDGIFPLYSIDDRNKTFAFLKNPVEIRTTSLFTLKSNPYVYDGNYSSLKGMSIGFVKDGSFGPIDSFLHSSDITAVPISSLDTMIKMLTNGRFTAYIDSREEVIEYLTKANKFSLVKVHKIPIAEMPATLALTRKKQWGDLPHKLDRALEEMINDGTFQRLSQQPPQ